MLFEDLLEAHIEAEADHLYDFEPSSSQQQQQPDRGFLFAELEKTAQLRTKKHHRSIKPHRAVRSNDCRFPPHHGSNGSKYYMKARNFQRIGRNRVKFEKKTTTSADSKCVNLDGYYLNESNSGRLGDDRELTNLLLALQNGSDVTPDDYERLLMLDELNRASKASSNSRRHAADRVLETAMNGLSLLDVENGSSSNAHQSSILCAICMDSESSEESGDFKNLLCGHTFHTDCLRHWWLTSPNMTCPLDNTDVRDMRPPTNGRVTEPIRWPIRSYCI